MSDRFEVLLLLDDDEGVPRWHLAGEIGTGDVWSLDLPAGARRIAVRPQRSDEPT
jgi:hypothetical protein